MEDAILLGLTRICTEEEVRLNSGPIKAWPLAHMKYKKIREGSTDKFSCPKSIHSLIFRKRSGITEKYQNIGIFQKHGQVDKW